MYVIDAGRHNAVDLENFFLVIDIFIAVIKVYIVHGIGGGWGGVGYLSMDIQYQMILQLTLLDKESLITLKRSLVINYYLGVNLSWRWQKLLYDILHFKSTLNKEPKTLFLFFI